MKEHYLLEMLASFSATKYTHGENTVSTTFSELYKEKNQKKKKKDKQYDYFQELVVSSD